MKSVPDDQKPLIQREKGQAKRPDRNRLKYGHPRDDDDLVAPGVAPGAAGRDPEEDDELFENVPI